MSPHTLSNVGRSFEHSSSSCEGKEMSVKDTEMLVKDVEMSVKDVDIATINKRNYVHERVGVET